ncbi:MAG: hypothetical protein QM731_12470 [Chitinophagaceae bacterium]
MELTAEQYEKISAWFAGTMPEEERQAFLLEVAANPALQEVFEFNRLLSEEEQPWQEAPGLVTAAQQSSEYQQYKKKLGALSTGNSRQHTGKVIAMQRRKWMIAVILLIVGGLLTWFLLQKKEPAPLVDDKKHNTIDTPKNQLPPVVTPPKGQLAYEKFFNTYTPSDLTPIELQQVAALYKKGNYPGALNELKGVAEIRGNNPDEKMLQVYADFYNGLCQLSLQQPDSARAYLEKAYSNRNNATALRDDIGWYLSLAYIRIEQQDKATPLLNILKRSTNKKYREQAAILLEQYK